MKGEVNFTSSAALVNRLGGELIKDPHTAFFELIKNSYDADATEVNVIFHKTAADSGKIIIQDNGSGMTLEELKSKWARAAGENKIRKPYTPRFNRRMLGAKGIGRFSVAKLGAKVKIITRPEGQREQMVFSLNFKDFTDDRDFGDMKIPYTFGAPRTGFTKGTIIEIAELHHRWGKRDIQKVRNQLCHLIDPDQQGQNFSIHFDCPDWPDLSGGLKNPISGRESHLVRFQIDKNGKYNYEMEGPEIPLKKSQSRQAPLFGPVKGIIRYFKDGLKSRDRQLAEGIDDSHVGVKIYRDGCRVRPYGEPSDDWLEVKAHRARGGGKYYILAQNLAGSVHISAETNKDLVDATNREAGIIENEAFLEFQKFVREQIDLLNHVLEQETKSESQKQKRHTVKKILDTIVRCLNQQESDVYGGYVDHLDRRKRGGFGQTYTQKNAFVKDLKKPTKTEWLCRDCDARWRVLEENTPTICMEFAVNRQGALRDVEGCGSTNIERAKHEKIGRSADLSSVISGQYALIAGKQIRVRVDYEMGDKEDEYRVEEREILINGNHPAYVVAEKLDGMSGKKYEIGDDVFVPALTTHIAKCACLSWAELHYKKTGIWDDFKEKYELLLNSICASVRAELD